MDTPGPALETAAATQGGATYCDTTPAGRLGPGRAPRWPIGDPRPGGRITTTTGGSLAPSPQRPPATLPQRIEGLKTSLDVLKELLPKLFPPSAPRAK